MPNNNKENMLALLPMKHTLFINRNFVLLWIGQAISVTGDFLFTTTVVLWITTQIAQGQSWAPLAVSGSIVASTLPVFLIGPVAGVFVDRWRNKRLTMLCMDALRALLLLLLLVSSSVLLPGLTSSSSSVKFMLGLIYSIILLTGICSQFFDPSNLVLTSMIVEKSAIPQATGLDQTTKNIAALIGPSLGALLFFSIGYWGALFLDALSFLISFLTILAIRVPKQAESSADNEAGHRSTFVREFWEGLRFYRKNRVLTTLLVSISLVMVTSGALGTLNIFFLTQNLATKSSFYGLMPSFIGAGAVLGAILVTLLLKYVSTVNIYWCFLLGEGLMMIIYARITYFPLSLVLLFIFGMLVAGVNVATPPLILRVTPKHFLGRAMSVFNPITRLAYMLSVLFAGFLDSVVLHNFHHVVFTITFGPIDTIFTIAGVLAIISSFYAVSNLRDLRENQDVSSNDQQVEAISK